MFSDFDDLFLVDDDAISFFEYGLELREGVRDGFIAMFSVDEGGDIVHGTGSIEGDESDNFLYIVRFKFFDGVAHAE